MRLAIRICAVLFAGSVSVWAFAEKTPVESDYYPLVRCEAPQDVVLEACGFQLMPDGRMAVCTRRGEIWMIENPDAPKITPSQFKLFASGLHECLTLAERDGWLYAVQRGELTRMKDTDGDGLADVFETVSDDWEISGDFHEYAFGSKFDPHGDLWVTLCLTNSFTSDVPFRGWGLRVRPDGTMVPAVSGVRSPGGMGANAEGDLFYTDNQGPWNGTNSLKVLRQGGFAGHPDGLKWFDLTKGAMGTPPLLPRSGSRFIKEAERIAEFDAPVVLFPYKKMGQSATGIVCDQTGGRFGPFENQLFVGDMIFSTVMRVDLEKVNGHYQGACFPFREGIGSGTVGLEFSPEGGLFVGGSSRGWGGSRGPREFSLERLNWSGQVPFEIKEMRALPNGFRLNLTQPVNLETASRPESYSLETYAYIFQEGYGSPEVDQTRPRIQKVEVSSDGMSVSLIVDRLQPGHVHELHAPGLRSSEGLPLLHAEAYYTLNAIPKS